MTKTINYNLSNVDANNCAFTKNGWKIIFPIILVEDDHDPEDLEFYQAYADAIESAEGELIKHAEMMSISNYTLGQWSKAINSSFSEATKKLHDLVMGNNGCDELIFRLEVIDKNTIEIF